MIDHAIRVRECADALKSAIAEMCLAIFNTNEFIYMP